MMTCSFPEADELDFGSNCQDNSVAGKMEKRDGPGAKIFMTQAAKIRSLPKDQKPKCMLHENVVGFEDALSSGVLPDRFFHRAKDSQVGDIRFLSAWQPDNPRVLQLLPAEAT